MLFETIPISYDSMAKLCAYNLLWLVCHAQRRTRSHTETLLTLKSAFQQAMVCPHQNG
tara:strand:- start:630 stop:803 length:174 start_codon:yes stop_codon:yes gene_type:complete